MTRKTEEREKRQERTRLEDSPPPDSKKRKPRGALFRSGDPTLARRLEDEVYDSKR